MSFEITEIIDVGPGWNKVRMSDGQIYTLEGNYNWRSNNPGNIEYGDFAISQGAIGEGAVPKGRSRGFAIFPSYEAGQKAREVLQFETPSYLNADNAGRWGHSYPKGSIGAAIYRYAPPTENDTEGYIRQVSSAAGVSPHTLMKDLNPEQRAAFMQTQQAHEGWREGAVYNGQGVKLPPEEIPTVGSSLSTRAPKTAPTPQVMSDSLSKSRAGIGTVAARTNAMFDQQQSKPPAPVPAPRAQGVAARTNAMLDQQSAAVPLPRPVTRAPQQAMLPALAPPANATPAPVPKPATQRPAAQKPAADLALTGKPNGVTPVLTAEGDNAYTYWIPDRTPASLVGGLGSLTPGIGAASKSAPQQAPTPVSRPVPSGGLVKQDAVAPKQTPAVVRTQSSTPNSTAGNVAMPATARPAIADSLIQQAQQTSKKIQPVPSNGGYAGQETAKPTPPKYITETIKIEVPAPERKAIPLGDVMHHGSRDSVAQKAAGEKVAQELTFKTRTVTRLNPEWVEAQKPVTKPQAPVGPAPGLGQQIVGGARQAVGLPVGGLGPGIVQGFQQGFADSRARLNTPIAMADRQAALATPQNHNPAAMAAIADGQKSYVSSDGSLQPTVAMNGKVRYTYGD